MGTKNQEKQSKEQEISQEAYHQVLKESMNDIDEIIKFRDFVNDVKRRIIEKVEENKEVRIEIVPKNNDYVRIALIIKEPDAGVSPSLYLDRYYEEFLDGTSMDEIVEDILETYKKIVNTHQIDVNALMDFEKVKDKIIMKLVNKELNIENLKYLPNRDFADLSLVYMVDVTKEVGSLASFTINEHHLKKWDVTEEELYYHAIRNTPRKYEARMMSMYTLHRYFSGESIQELDDTDMHILTNSTNVEGATCMVYKGILKQVKEMFEGDFYICPCSIHELIIAPKKCIDTIYSWENLKERFMYEIEEDIKDRKFQSLEDIPEESDFDIQRFIMDDMKNIINQANKELRSEMEVLGNHAYICDGEKLIWIDEATDERKEFVLD